MIILLEVMVYKRGHILGIKKGLLLFPSATLKTHLWRPMQLLQRNQQEYNRYYLQLWFLNLSLFHHLPIELSAAPSTNYASPTSLYPNSCGSAL